MDLLKRQLANSADIDLVFFREAATNLESIDKPSLMLVMLGENYGVLQQYEILYALAHEVPIVSVLSNENIKIQSPIISSEGIPTVNWNWNEISGIVSGHAHSIEYEAPENIDLESPIIRLDFSKISEELTQYILTNPDAMQNISPRKFEQLVAYIMEKRGYEVTLTQQSRDGGIDIFALKNEGFGNILTIVDCKKYSNNNPVRIAAVRCMYGTLQIESASHGIIATTSRFTQEAIDLAQEYKYQLSLKDHADILKWVQESKI